MAAVSAIAAEKPNFVIMFCDDQGYGDLGSYGSKVNKTPNIDKLAAQGMRFTDFYSAYSVCSASRASLLTGSYRPRIGMRGVLWPGQAGFDKEEITIADMLKSKGYATMCVGKWHVGETKDTLPTAQGFDHYFGLPYSNDMGRKKDWEGRTAADLDKIWAQKKWDIYDNHLYRDTERIEGPVNQVTMTNRYTEEAVKFINTNKDKPFFLYFAHTMPHVPLFVSDDLYDPDPQKAYKLVTEHIDWSVGEVMKALDDNKIAVNTFVIYTSDNGPWLSKKHHGGSALPLRAGKMSVFEGGMRVPGIMRWPERIKPGQVCNQVAGTIDLIATFATIVGAELPADKPTDSLDISALLDDPKAPSPHDEKGLYYYFRNGLEAIRLGKWKLHLKKKELYDLRADIAESKNVAGEHPEVVENLIKVATAYDADLKANSRGKMPQRKNKNKKGKK